MKAQRGDINYLVNSVIEKINKEKPANWTEGTPRVMYDLLEDHPHKYDIMTTPNTPEGKWVKYYKEFMVVRKESDELQKQLSAENEALDPMLGK